MIAADASSMRTVVRWMLRALILVVAAAGGWLTWFAVGSLWLAAQVFWTPHSMGGMAAGIGHLMGAIAGIAGVVFGVVGLGLLALAWSMSGLPRPTRLRGWFAHERFLRRSSPLFAPTPDLDPGMSQRRISFEHDGHQFEAVEQVASGATAPASLVWAVSMDGAPALDFAGDFPYRDPDVVKRVVEWYEIQRPRLGG